MRGFNLAAFTAQKNPAAPPPMTAKTSVFVFGVEMLR